jgi:hypothetical protein
LLANERAIEAAGDAIAKVCLNAAELKRVQVSLHSSTPPMVVAAAAAAGRK